MKTQGQRQILAKKHGIFGLVANHKPTKLVKIASIGRLGLYFFLALSLAGCLSSTRVEAEKNVNQTRVNEKPIEVTTRIYLTRHAQKSKEGGKDPNLSMEGQATARRLAEYLRMAPIDSIYSTPYKRTRQTAAPIAELKGVKVTELYLPAHEMARLLVGEYKGKTVLVVGHSNTTPALLKHLGATESITIGENDYAELFILTIEQGKSVNLQRVKY